MKMAVAAALAGTVLILLSACNDQSSSSNTEPVRSSAPNSPTPPSVAPSMSPIATQPTSRPRRGETAAPKSQYTLGAEATVPFTSGGKVGMESVTVISVRKGSEADLAALNISGQIKGMVPYYVHAVIKNVGATDLSFSSNNHFNALLDDGSEAQSLSVIGHFSKCDSTSAPSGFTIGKSYQTCTIALSPAASAVTGADYWGDPYGVDGALVWK